MSTTRPLTRARRIRRRVLAGAAIVFVVGWLLSHYRPVWYRPARITEAELPRIRGEVTVFLDEFGDALVAGQPFEAEISATQLNDWLAAWPELYPSDNPLALVGVHEPAIGFSTRGIDAGGRFRSVVFEAIVHARLDVQISPDGSGLLIAVTRARIGSLPAPTALIMRLVGNVSNLTHGAKASSRDAMAGEGRLRLVNRFIWPNGRRAFRIRSLALDSPGTMRLVIEPM